MGMIIISHSSKDKNIHFFKYLLVYVNTASGLNFHKFKSLWGEENSLGYLFILANLDLMWMYLEELGGYKDT